MKKTLNLDSFFAEMSMDSEYDIAQERHHITIDESDFNRFIAEQVGRFTSYLMNSIEDVETRKEYFPFDNLSNKYPRERSYLGTFIECPFCHEILYEDSDWNDEEDISCECPYCRNELEIETEN